MSGTMTKGTGARGSSPGHVIDAHVHLGPVSKFYAAQSDVAALLRLMDRLSVRFAVCTDHLSLYEGAGAGLTGLKRAYQESKGRIHYLGVFDPKKSRECMKAIEKALSWPGFSGIKIHPSFHGVPADDPGYREIWEFAATNGLAILTHSWSASEHNPSQILSSPRRFEKYIENFSSVPLVLAHAGGRGYGRKELIRLIGKYDNVFTDIAGDIYCFRLLETLLETIPPTRIIFGSDFPWLDPRSNLARIFLSSIDEGDKEKILCENAMSVYKIARSCSSKPRKHRYYNKKQPLKHFH
jgi:hypothetical protein